MYSSRNERIRYDGWKFFSNPIVLKPIVDKSRHLTFQKTRYLWTTAVFFKKRLRFFVLYHTFFSVKLRKSIFTTVLIKVTQNRRQLFSYLTFIWEYMECASPVSATKHSPRQKPSSHFNLTKSTILDKNFIHVFQTRSNQNLRDKLSKTRVRSIMVRLLAVTGSSEDKN